MKERFLILLLLVLAVSLKARPDNMDDIEARLEEGYKAEDEARFEDAIRIYEEQLELIPKDSVTWISDLCATLLNCHLRIGQLQRALSYGERSLQLDEAMDDKARISSSLNNLASVLITAGRLDRAEEYLIRAVEMERELGEEDKLAVRLGMLAEVYTKMKKPEMALPLAKEALELDRKGGREAKAAIRMSQYGNVLASLKHAAEALPYLTEALRLHRQYANYPSEAITLVALGMTENDLGKRAEAERHLQECITLAQERGLIQPLMTAHHELSKLYNEVRNPDAYAHLQQYVSLKDSLNSIQVQQQISDLEVKYETKQKQQELEKQKLLIQRQRFIYISLSIVLLLALAVVIFLVVAIRLKNQNMMLKDRFMQIISHDLKNPALAQQKSLHMLSKNASMFSQDEMHGMLNQLAEDADAQVNLLYSLLDWAGLQTGRLRFTPTTLDLSLVSAEVVTQLRIQANVKEVTILTTNDDESHIVTADRQMTEAMIRNLLSNAIKFSDKGSEVRVNVKGTCIEIDDDGIGFGTDGGEKGTGLGLKLVTKLARINKAQFEISAKSSKGTLASLSFQRKMR